MLDINTAIAAFNAYRAHVGSAPAPDTGRVTRIDNNIVDIAYWFGSVVVSQYDDDMIGMDVQPADAEPFNVDIICGVVHVRAD